MYQVKLIVTIIDYIYRIDIFFIYLETKWMKLILAFGAGSLLGDAFLHLLPEVIGYRNWPYG